MNLFLNPFFTRINLQVYAFLECEHNTSTMKQIVHTNIKIAFQIFLPLVWSFKYSYVVFKYRKYVPYDNNLFSANGTSLDLIDTSVFS